MPAPAPNRILARLTTLLFLLALLPPALLLRVDPDAAAAEKRTAAPVPALPRSLPELAAFPRAFDAFFNDHFGLRRPLITTHARLAFFGLHTSPSPKVYRGRDGWLFYDGLAAGDGDSIADARGLPPLSPGTLERWRWMLQDQHDWLTAHGLHHLIAFVPAKEVVYPDRLPGHLAPLGPPAIAQMTDYLRARTDLPVLDLTPALLAARADGLVYHPNDTHWNDAGAYVGYREIQRAVAAWFPAAAPLPPDAFIREELTGPGGDLADMIHVADRHRQTYVFLNPRTPRRATVTPLGRGDLADVIARTDDPALPRAAILRDSFTEMMIPFLSEHYHSVHYQWARTGFEASLLERVDPQLVIQIIADRAFRKERRYPAGMEAFALQARFARATPVDAPAPPVAAPGSRLTPAADGGWILTAETGSPALLLTPPGDPATDLPLLHLAFTAASPGEINATWTSREPDPRGLTTRRTTPTRFATGPADHTLAIVDPAIHTPLTLHFHHTRSPLTLHHLEWRTVPR